MSRGKMPVDGVSYVGVARDCYICTPSDEADLPTPGRAFQVRGEAGDVAVINASGRTVTIPNVAAGEMISVAVRRVLDSGTDATDILIYV
jgi:hypothetical protein